MMKRRKKTDRKNNNGKKEHKKGMENGWIDRRKNMEKERQKKNTSCIINLV